MQLSNVGRRLAVVLAVAVVATAAALATPAVASNAQEPPHVEQRTSLFDTDPTKSVSVMCPVGSWVFAVGGQISGKDGTVLMTRMYPSDDLRWATVTAKARTNSSVPFSVTVYAVCAASAHPPLRIRETVDQASTVTARCPDQTILLGLGFAQDRPVDDWRVDALVPDADLKEVRVHATGGGSAGPLTVFGICYHPTMVGAPQIAPHRVETVSYANGTWPNTVAIKPGYGGTFGVGGSVMAPGEVHLDGFLPYDAGGVRAAQAGSASTPAGLRSRLLAVTADEDGGTVTGYAIRIGTFH